MLIQSKIDRNSELQKPFFGDSALFLEDTPNILFNSLSPVYKVINTLYLFSQNPTV